MASMSIPHSGRQLGRVSPIPPRSSFRFLHSHWPRGWFPYRIQPRRSPSPTIYKQSSLCNGQCSGCCRLYQVEVEVGRLVGPLGEHVLPLVKTSPIGLVPKSHQVDKWRRIVDLSFPRGLRVNSGIISRVIINQVDDAVNLILQLGLGTELVKLDLKSAYCLVPIHQEDHDLMVVSCLHSLCTTIWPPFCSQNLLCCGRYDLLGLAVRGYFPPTALLSFVRNPGYLRGSTGCIALRIWCASGCSQDRGSSHMSSSWGFL